MARWRFTWAWAGMTGEVLDVAPSFTETSDLYASLQGESSVRLVVRLRGISSVAAVVNSGVPLFTGTGELYHGDQLVMSGRWSEESEYGADDEPLTIVLSESWEDDGGLWPPLGEAPRSTPAVLADELAGRRPGTVTPRTWPTKVYPAGQGAGYPYVIGSPGTSLLPGSPAPVVADGSVTAINVMVHAGPMRGTVTLWGTEKTADAATGTGVPSLISQSVTVSTSSDLLGCTCSVVAFNSAAVGYPGWSNGGGNYFVSFNGTASGAPSGAGAVALSALEVATPRVDIGAARAVAPLLDRYRLDGYVDDRVEPLQWLARQLVPILPVALVRGPFGATLTPWPWLDSATDAAYHLREGAGFARASGVTCSTKGAPSLVRVMYGWCPSTGSYTGEVPAGAADTLQGRIAATLLPRSGGTRTIETRLVWDAATASRIARDRISALALPRRTIAYQCDPGLYGAGGRWELRAGLPLLLTDEGLRLSRAPAVVRRIERAGDRMRVDLDLRDDGMHPAG